MADIADRAEQQEAIAREEALARLFLAQAQARSPGQRASLTHCADCAEVIPLKRRRAIQGCIRCIDCQEYFEKYQKRAKQK